MFFPILILLSNALLLDASSAQVRLDQSFFDFLAPYGRELLEAENITINIPDYQDKISGIHVYVHNYRNLQITLPIFNFSLGDDGLTWKTSGGHVGIEADWTIEKRVIAKIRESGRVTVDTNGINLLITATITVQNSRPHIDLVRCQSQINNVNVGIHGHFFAAIARLFRSKIENAFKKGIERTACRVVTDIFDKKINPKLAALPTEIPLKDGIVLSYSMEQPIFTPDFVEAGLNASIIYGDEVSTPFSQLEFHGQPNEFMGALVYDENLINYFLTDLHQTEKISFKVDNSIPELAPFLRTTCIFLCIGKFAPSLWDEYPNRSVQFFVESTQAPQAHFSTGQLRIDATLAISMNLTYVEGAENPDNLAVFLLNGSFAIDGYIENSILKAHLLQSDATLQVVSSEIGTIDLSNFNYYLEEALPLILKVVFASGYKIPSYAGVKIADSSKLVSNDGYGEVDINLAFV